MILKYMKSLISWGLGFFYSIWQWHRLSKNLVSTNFEGGIKKENLRWDCSADSKAEEQSFSQNRKV
jgi:hypothetical protein